MRLRWTLAAQKDLGRLHGFLAQHDLDAADRVFDALVEAPEALLEYPRLGSKLEQFGPREIRELRAGRHVMRYELNEREIRVLRIFHVREDRA